MERGSGLINGFLINPLQIIYKEKPQENNISLGKKKNIPTKYPNERRKEKLNWI